MLFYLPIFQDNKNSFDKCKISVILLAFHVFTLAIFASYNHNWLSNALISWEMNRTLFFWRTKNSTTTFPISLLYLGRKSKLLLYRLRKKHYHQNEQFLFHINLQHNQRSYSYSCLRGLWSTTRGIDWDISIKCC